MEVKKTIISIFLAVILCLSASVMISGCSTDKTFTVTFEAGVEDAYLVEGEEVQTVTNANQLVPPKYARDGYVHDNWDKVLSEIKSSTTVKATWIEKTFSVSFLPGAPDAVLVSGNESQEVGSGLQLVPPVYERKGYEISWEHVNFAAITAETTITAQWKAKKYQLSFVDSNGESLGLNEKEVVFGQLVGELPTLDDKADYTFGGWQYIDSENQNNVVLISETSEWIYANGATLKALWCEVGEFPITYLNAFNHSNRPSYKETQEVVLQAPTRLGYKFLGWSGTDIDGIIKDVVIPVGSTGAREYTAHWDAEVYNVYFDANGGTVTPSSKQVTYNQTVGKLPVPVKEGFEFINWTTENGTIVSETDTWTTTSNVFLYAKYKRVYTIKFVLETTVRGDSVICTIPNTYINEHNLVKSNTETNVYILQGYKEGNSLPELPIVTTNYADEYAFAYWSYNGSKKNAGTVINETNFPGSTTSGVITLKVVCYALWTPFY